MNIAKRDVLELRRRLTKRECSISRTVSYTHLTLPTKF